MSTFEWSLPYPSQREPVTAEAIVATSVPIAAQAGLEMLRRGGSAADAAVATAACMTVVEPTTNGIGGDAFALVWDGERVHGLNGSGRSPKGLDADRILELKSYPRTGWDPITVPGCVQAWVDLWQRFGRLEFGELLEPAIRYARDGFLVAPQTARLWNGAAPRYEQFEAWRDTFTFDGRAPRAGERVRLPDHAATLEAIAATHADAFYRGELAERIVAASRAANGTMEASDLAEHRSEWVDPISVAYRDRVLHEIPPNGQGIAALIALGILERFDVAGLGLDTPETIHHWIEATKLGFADAHRQVSDPAWARVSPGELLAPARLDELAASIDPTTAQAFDAGIPKPGGTILLATADAEGNCVSFIQSNYTGFGSGVVIPGTGIAMQNRGACFTLEEDHPNCVGPEKRPYHTIIPALATPAPGGDPASGLMAFGVMGGFMQPQGHLQVLARMADFRQNPQAALDAPRYQWMRGVSVQVEPGFDASVYDGLSERGHRVRATSGRSVSFGRGQAIHRLEHGWCGASDLRADGQAVGL